MPNSPNNLSRFWQELKRRKVIYVITVYASAAFVIIELVNNVAEPLNLPERTSTFVIIALAIGFPIAVIISWIFDLTPAGIEKTQPMSEAEDKLKPAVQNRWKIATYISMAVIIGLIILNLTGGKSRLKAGDIQSLVILPFENFTGDDQLEWFVSGLHFSLIGDIQKIGGLKVISKTSSDVYKDVEMSVEQVTSELNVDIVVEGAVMCFGEDSLCIRFSLITPDEEQIWFADYKEERSQILNLYSRVTETIADEVMVELTAEEKKLFAEDRTVDREAYDAYLRSKYWDDLSQESLLKAQEYLNLAVEKDPDYAPLYAGLANVWGAFAQLGFEPPEIAGPKIFENLNKAMELDPDFPEVHAFIAGIAVWSEWDWAKGEQEYIKALTVNPNDALSRVFYGHLLMILQRKDEALSQAQLAVELSPLDPLILALSAVVIDFAGDTKLALDQLDKALSLDPHHFFAMNLIEQIAFKDRDYDKAFEAGKFMMTNDFLSDEKDAVKEIERVFEEQGFFAAYEVVVQKMETMAQEEYINPIELAVRYAWLKDQEKTMDWIEKGFEARDQNMPYITTGVFDFDSLYHHPRFIAIIEKMNLPLPQEN